MILLFYAPIVKYFAKNCYFIFFTRTFFRPILGKVYKNIHILLPFIAFISLIFVFRIVICSETVYNI